MCAESHSENAGAKTSGARARDACGSGVGQQKVGLELDTVHVGAEQSLVCHPQPAAHFPPQREGDLVKDGVCGLFIAEKLGVSAPTASEHLRILTAAGLLRATRIKKWTFYRRNEPRIREVKRLFRSAW